MRRKTMRYSGKEYGFTLVELLITISLIVLITSVIYFTMSSALESWAYARDRLSLQKVLSETVDTVINGKVGDYGLKDSLQIIQADQDEMSFVPPWVDSSHSVANAEFIYTLDKRVKPGAAVPIAQVQLSDSAEWKVAPVSMVQLENSEESQVKLNLLAPEGSGLRFIFHPDPEEHPETIHRFYYDRSAKHVFLENHSGKENISQNLFGVEITRMELTYYTNTNQLVTDRESVDDSEIQLITGVEIHLEAKLNQETESLRSFVSLRNAPMRTGYLSLKRGMKIRIPDSKTIQTLMLTNFAGISNNDRIQLEANPESGKSWRVTLHFEKIGGVQPTIAKVVVEYPPDTPVFMDFPKSGADLGLNLKLLGTDGLYDYDDDEDVEDTVKLEGHVELEVTEMNMKGAGLFMRP